MAEPRSWLWRFSDWSIVAKVMASSLVMLFALAALALVGWKTLQNQRVAMLASYNEILPNFDKASRIAHYVSEVEANLYRLATWRRIGVGGPEMRNVLQSIDFNLTRADTAITQLEQAGMPRIGALRAAYDDYRASASQSLVLLLRNPSLGATAVRGGSVQYRTLEQTASDVARVSAEKFRAGAEAATRQMDRLAGEFIFVGLVIATLAMLVSVATARTILQPITNIVSEIDRLQRGDLSGEISNTERGDEIGRISQSVTRLKVALEQNEMLARDREKKQEELEFAATHDTLTGLANRSAFDAHLNALMQSDRRRRKQVCFVLADLDGFKPINDAYGHGAGDAVLRTLANRYCKLVRSGDMVARLGGDEFALLFALDAEHRDPTAIARRVLEATALPIEYEGRQLRVGVSIGVVQEKDVDGGPAELMVAADQALYLAKERKQPWYTLYQPEMALERLGLEDREELEHAIECDEFTLFYKTILDLRDGSLHGVEARAYWARANGPLLAPDVYLPLLEHFGLRHIFAMHIARRALNDMRDLVGRGLDPGSLSLNVDATTLATRSSFEELRGLLEGYPELSNRLTIEITDDALSDRGSAIIRENVKDLARRGMRISMDDFGAGYASFQHLREFDIDELKIDRSFIAGIGVQHTSAVIIEGFLSIATGLGARVVAEGVETEEQRRFLLKRGCHFGQGSLLGPQLPIRDLTDYLAQNLSDKRNGQTAS
uniref:putative bifunctional diguanylate cyclase/phosphodiesterase n=1 Tax=Stappia sp. TaxID=1870903 RepID=UPI003BABBF48